MGVALNRHLLSLLGVGEKRRGESPSWQESASLTVVSGRDPLVHRVAVGVAGPRRRGDW